jgi:hypothetical protein
MLINGGDCPWTYLRNLKRKTLIYNILLYMMFRNAENFEKIKIKKILKEQ